MKVVFIIETPYWMRDHHRFGMDYMMENGYDVEIWRVINNTSINFDSQAGMYNGENYYEISEKQFNKRLLDNKNAIFFSNISERRLLIGLMSTGVDYILLKGMGGIMEFPNEKEEEKIGLINRFKRRMAIGITQSFFNLVLHISNYCDYKRYLKLLYKNPPRLIITSTHCMADRYLLPEEKNCNVMFIHSMDYDRYLEARRNELQKCILYCDSGFFDLDQDFIIHPRPIPTLEHRDECLEQLNDLFQRLEEYYGVPVVVAGHPHVKYLSDSFCGRKIVYNKTHELAASAKVFVLQTSTAISYAALWDIPMIQIVNSYFNELDIPPGEGTYAYNNICYQAKMLGSGFLDLDDREKAEHPWDFVKRIDPDKRKQYIEKYIIDSDKTDKTIIEYLDEYLQTQQFAQS